MGGMIAAIERGFPQSEIAAASYRYQHAIETGERIIVGVNAFRVERPADRAAADRRNRRGAPGEKLAALKRGAITPGCSGRWTRCSAPREGTENTMPLHSGCRARLCDRSAKSAMRSARCSARTGSSVFSEAQYCLQIVYMNACRLWDPRRTAPYDQTMDHRFECWWPSPDWTATTAAPRSSRALCAMPGMEVIYTGLRQTPEMIVNAALQEDVQVIGLSILSGAHNAIVPRVMELLREKEMTDVLVIVGGIIPDEDAAALEGAGRGRGVSTRRVARRNCGIHPHLGEADGLIWPARRKNQKMQEKLNIAVFVDYDNIEIGVKSTLRREFDVSLALDALEGARRHRRQVRVRQLGTPGRRHSRRWRKTPSRWCSAFLRRAATRTAPTSTWRSTRWRWPSPTRM